MSEYYNTKSLLSGRAAPEFDVNALLKGSKAIQEAFSSPYQEELLANKLLEDKARTQHALDREKITDARYDEQQLKTDAEKNRLIGKEINTANAMQAIYNPDEYKSLRMSSEQKAIQDTLANATPEDRLQMQQEIKGYDPKASGQQWVNTAIGQSNVDSSKLADLRMDMDKQRIQQEQFDENKRLQAEQNRISASNSAESNRLKSRELDIQENKINLIEGILSLKLYDKNRNLLFERSQNNQIVNNGVRIVCKLIGSFFDSDKIANIGFGDGDTVVSITDQNLSGANKRVIPLQLDLNQLSGPDKIRVYWAIDFDNDIAGQNFGTITEWPADTPFNVKEFGIFTSNMDMFNRLVWSGPELTLYSGMKIEGFFTFKITL